MRKKSYWFIREYNQMVAWKHEKVLCAFLRCLLNNGAAYSHIPLHALLVWPVSHFSPSSGPLKSCPPGSIRNPTCSTAVVAMAMSPPASPTGQSQVHGGVRGKGWSRGLGFLCTNNTTELLFSSSSSCLPRICIHHEPQCWKQFWGQHRCM